jgi:hypothetical protein
MAGIALRVIKRRRAAGRDDTRTRLLGAAARWLSHLSPQRPP